MKARIVYKTNDRAYVLESEVSKVKTIYVNYKMHLNIISEITGIATEIQIPMENIISMEIE